MAVNAKVIMVNGRPNDYHKKTFMIRSPEDVANLPTSTTTGNTGDKSNDQIVAIGSTAYTQDYQHTYNLTLDDEWVEVRIAGGVGGGTGSQLLDFFIDVEEDN